MTTPKREEPPFVSDERKPLSYYLNNTLLWSDEDMIPKDPDHQRRLVSSWLKLAKEQEAELSRIRTEQEGKWIPVTERLPEPEQMVLAFYEDEETGEGFMNAENYNAHHWTVTSEVTHWMPLPAPPAL